MRYFLSALVGLLIHAGLIIGNPNSKLNLYYFYDKVSSKFDNDGAIWVLAAIVSFGLAILFLLIRKITKKDGRKNYLEALSFFIGSYSSFLVLALITWLVFKNCCSF